MFGIGPLELIVIAIVAVVFIGPEKLPDAMRKFGKFFVQIRRHANDVKGGFQEIIHDAERELELEKIRELQAKLQNVSPSSMLNAALKEQVNPTPPENAAHVPGTEAYDYHESHYVDGVYAERGPDHVLVADPILQPDPLPVAAHPAPMTGTTADKIPAVPGPEPVAAPAPTPAAPTIEKKA